MTSTVLFPVPGVAFHKRGKMKIRGVVFDMDGVLCDSEPFLFRASRQMFQENYGLAVVKADFAPFVGTGEDRYLCGVAEGYSVELRMPADKLRTYAIYLDLIKERLAPLDGVLEFVARCQSAALRIAVATSADRVKMEGNLRQIGLPPERFDYCVTGSEVTHKKPHPEIFLTAARHLGIPPDECLVVEDAPSGIAAAQAAGSAALGLTTTFPAEQLVTAGARWTAPNLGVIPQDLDRTLFSTAG